MDYVTCLYRNYHLSNEKYVGCLASLGGYTTLCSSLPSSCFDFFDARKISFWSSEKTWSSDFFYTYVATNLTICCLRKKCTCTFSLHCFDVPRSFWTRNKSQRLLVKVGLWTSPISCKAKKNAALRIRKLPQVSSYCEDRPIITAI